MPILFGPIHIAWLEMVIDPVCALVFEADAQRRGVPNNGAPAEGLEQAKSKKPDNDDEWSSGAEFDRRAGFGPWSDFPEELPHYDFERTEIGPNSSAKEQKIEGLALPPDQDLQKYGMDNLYQEFLKQTDPTEKEAKVWTICLGRHREYRPENGEMMDTVQRQAWLFLLCTKHSFVHEVPDLAVAQYPSP